MRPICTSTSPLGDGHLGSAVVVGILAGMILGLLIYLLSIRPLQAASALTKAIATLAVLVMLQSVVTLRYGSTPHTVTAFLPSRPVDVFGTTIASEDLIIFGVCLLLVLDPDAGLPTHDVRHHDDSRR